MTDSFLLIDGVLWSVAAGLAAVVLWLTRADGPPWEPASFFGAVLSALSGPGELALTGGPVPEGGFEGTPAELEAVDDPRIRLGAGCGWQEVAGWTEVTRAAVARRTENVRLVWFEAPPVAVEGLETTVLDAVDLAALDRLLTRPDTRVILAAHARTDAVLRLLHEAQGLRDRLRAVLLVAPTLDAAWLAPNFTHLAFDTELNRRVPYLTLRSGPDAAAQRLPEPPLPPTGRRAIQVVDLGVLPPDHLADPNVGRALAALCAALG